MGLKTIVFCLVAYLVGSIPFGLIFSKILYRRDLREEGSGNIGTTNAMRVLGVIPGFLVFLCDFFKAYGVVEAAKTMGPTVQLLGGLSVVLGHIFSLFLRFKGGKGVAPWFGVMAAWSWSLGLLMGGVWSLAFFFLGRSFLGATVAALVFPFLWTYYLPKEVFQVGRWVPWGLSLLILWAHRSNFKQWGKENYPLGLRSRKDDPKS